MLILLCIVSIALALTYACFNYKVVASKEEGTEEMIWIAHSIRSGAIVFLKHEYAMLLKVAIPTAIAMGVFIDFSTAVAFVIGLIMSSAPCWIGMMSATQTNVRVTNEARKTGKLSSTVRVALQGASVMGLSVAAFSILGFIIVYLLFVHQLDSLDMVVNWIGFEFRPFTLTFSAYSFGCSFIAIFARIGGGIYTKAADMGADLVGKNEMDIPEDDPRNPATIADNVGDNVGDVAGLGSDLLESNVGAIISVVLLGIFVAVDAIVSAGSITQSQIKSLCLFPIGVAALGLISCTIALFLILHRNMSDIDPQKDLDKATVVSALLVAVSTAILTCLMFAGFDYKLLSFNFGIISPWIAILVGIVCGIIIGKVSEYYTSYDYEPTKRLALACKEGPSICITQGMSLGMQSCLIPTLLLGISLFIAHTSCGTYGVALAAVGMLSFVGTTVSVDTYGPISDNAGGIAEMAHLNPNVRAITDKADAVGNTTAAIGKGFAIGSAAFATLGIIINYVNSYNEAGTELVLNVLNPLVLIGLLIGSALPFYFSGMLIDKVSEAAGKMVLEVRRQFKEIAGLRNGTTKPDYDECIKISSIAALHGMKAPALLGIVFAICGGFICGPDFVGALLVGATLSAIALAIFCGNAGGAWDNAKKYIEIGGVPGEGKGSEAHRAAVVGDTVGDPLKDTLGPSMDIMIKIMSTVSLIAVSGFFRFNLFAWLASLLG